MFGISRSSITNKENLLCTEDDTSPFINIKITRVQQQWLADTARTVSDNNDTPVAPNERVFPQHLVGVAIDLQQAAEIDRSQIKNLEDLRQHLRL